MSRSAARTVAERLVAAGHRTVLAGGCVRDRLLDRPVHDIDIATAASADEVMALFERTIPVGEAFGVVKVVTDDGVFDVATFRQDVGILDGRHPRAVEPATLEEDVRRRDFTINALVEDPVSGEVLDLVGGLEDLRAGRIRAIGEPVRRFREDALRLLRAVRFASVLGFAIEPDTLAGMRAESAGLARVSGERIRDELARMLAGPGRGRALALLSDAGLLAGALPECAAALADDPRRARVEARLGALPGEVGLPLALALLLALGVPPDERARAAEAMAARLRLSRDDSQRLVELVTLEAELGDAADWSRARLRRVLGHPAVDDLLSLHEVLHPDSPGLASLRAEVHRLAGAPALPEPWLRGADLLDLGVPPGPRVGELLDRAYALQLEEQLGSRDAARAWLRDQLDC